MFDVKKFFIAVILAVFILSAQIAAAVDWNSVPRINSKAELATYIENGRRKGYDTFHFYTTNTSILPSVWQNGYISKDEFVSIIPCHDLPKDNLLYGAIKDKCMQLAFKIIEYPGTHVANAYKIGDTSKLTPEELQLYYTAVEIVSEVNKRSSELAKAKYIHDEICRIADYPDNKAEITHENAIGALVYKKTDCEGYTDAFYMLGVVGKLKVNNTSSK